MIDDKDTKGSPSASLMRIPVEVRTIIFEQLFGRAELCATFDSYSSATYKKHSGKERRYYPNVSPMYDVGILQSCKQLNEEAAPILKSSLALSCIADDRIFSAAPFARCAKDVQFLTVFGLKWSHFDSLNEFPNLKVLRLNNDRYKRLDWLSSANDEYETEKQLEGFYDAGLKRVWKNDLLMTEWVREIEEQSERTFKIQHKAYMEMDTCHDGDRLIHNLSLTYDLDNMRTIKRKIEGDGLIKIWKEGQVRTYTRGKLFIDEESQEVQEAPKTLLRTVPWFEE